MVEDLANLVLNQNIALQHGKKGARPCDRQPFPRALGPHHLVARHRVPLVADGVANLTKLQPHDIVVDVPARVDVGEDLQRFLVPAHVDEPPRGLGHKGQHQDTREAPEALEQAGQAPRPAPFDLRRGIGDARRGQGPYVEEVVKQGQAPGALAPRQDLGEVGGARDGGGGGSEADDDAGGAEHAHVLGGALDAGCKDGDDGGPEEGGSSTVNVRQMTPEEAGDTSSDV